MRRLLAAVSLLAISSLAVAEDTSSPAPTVDTSIARGLSFLVKDAQAWRDEHHCVSCHHAGLVVWAMREAEQRGRPVDQPMLAELTKWIAESGDGKTGVPRPEGIPQALNEKAVSFALALNANPQPDQVSRDGLKLLLTTVKADQLESGAWASWPETRPPIFGNSDERATALAILALLPSAERGDETAKLALDRAAQWMSNTKTDDDPQSIALLLVIWRRLGRAADVWQPLVERIRSRQNADGGWSQTPELASDAWATGQALYALAHADVPSSDSSIQRGQHFLVTSQCDDGSWPMTSRPTRPGGEGSTSLIPITAAGSAWAVMGLVRSQ